MVRGALILFLLCFIPVAYAAAQAGGGLLTIDLSEDKVNITTGFNGARLALFGVKKEPGDIAIVVQGPRRDVVVRRKDQIMGIWLNRDSMRFRNVPVYYDLALSKPELQISNMETLEKYDIGLDALDFSAAADAGRETAERFKAALIRNKQSQGHFLLEPRNIIFLDGDFFRANFYMPADVPTGEYVINTYLFRDGAITDINETALRVAQVGFSARLYRFAHYHALAYGIAAVVLALTAGAAAYIFLRRE